MGRAATFCLPWVRLVAYLGRSCAGGQKASEVKLGQCPEPAKGTTSFHRRASRLRIVGGTDSYMFGTRLAAFVQMLRWPASLAVGSRCGCELPGVESTEAGIGGWLPKPPGFALFGNQQDATGLKTGGFYRTSYRAR